MNLSTFNPDTATNGDTLAAQTALKVRGFYAFEVDGDFGPVSRGALAAWKVAQDDPADDPHVILSQHGVTYIEHADTSVTFVTGMAVDSDGIGAHHGDRTASNDTSEHYAGHALNADTEIYFVPTQSLKGRTRGGEIMGCQGEAEHLLNGRKAVGVWGDWGPFHLDGEGSVLASKTLGIPSSPVSGGEPRHVVKYRMRPGTPAHANGRDYKLAA